MYPDPPPVIPVPESIAAQAVYQLRYKSTEYCSWVSSGPKCFQVLGLSPSLLPKSRLPTAHFQVFIERDRDLKENWFLLFSN